MSDQAEAKQEAEEGAAQAAAPSHSRTLARLVRGKNINETSLLATDYLNHFNEIIMILEMIPGMPDCLEDAQAWRPKSYADHFQDSAFSDRDLAILAYENAPARFREPFDSAVETMNALVARGLEKIVAALETGNEDLIADTAAISTSNLRKFVDVASAIIHGDEVTVDQSEIDDILNA